MWVQIALAQAQTYRRYLHQLIWVALACALNAQKLVSVGEGDTVLVMGASPIGCLHVRLARAAGAAKVFLADVNGDRLKLSQDVVRADRSIDMSEEDLGAVVLEETGGIGPSVVITAAPAGAAQEQALEIVAPGGRVSFFGGLPKDKPTITVDSNVVHYRELIIGGANGSSPAQNREALGLIASGAVPVADLVDALDGAPGVYSARYAGPNASDAENRNQLLAALAGAGAGDATRTARFRCVLWPFCCSHWKKF